MLGVLKANYPGATTAAEEIFRVSLQRANEKGALSWELRTATTLARLYNDRNDAKTARQTLEPIYHRFTEGFATADLVAAKRLLDELV
jgi:predicted ATPase